MNQKFKRHAFASVSLLLVLLAPLLSCSSSSGLLRVGNETITSDDVRYARSTAQCYGDTSATTESLIARLVTDLLEHEVLRSAFGDVPPDSILHQKAVVIKQTTQDSARLACIVAVGEAERYYRFVVRPTLVNPRLRMRYNIDTLIHAQPRREIQAIFQQLRSQPEYFLQQKLDSLRIERWQPAEPGQAKIASADPLVVNVISKLSLGRIWPHIIESDHDFRIVMLHGQSDSLYQVLAIRATKQPFDTWFREYAKQHVPITFSDAALEATIRNRYPILWWLP